MSEVGEPLSSREMDVLELLVQGMSNKEIAAKLHISGNTVKVHLRRIYRKLGVSSRTEAAHVAAQQNILTPAEEAILEKFNPQEDEDQQADEAPQAEIAHQKDGIDEEDGGVEPIELLVVKEEAKEETAVSESAPTFNWRLVVAIVVIFLVIAGGGIAYSQLVDDGEAVSEVPEYVETTLEGNWEVTNRPMPAGTVNMAVVADGVNIYKIGGETAVSVSNQAHVYNVTDRSWRELTEKPTAVTNITAAVLSGQIYVAGGRLADGAVTDVVEAYSPAQNAWREIAPLPQPIAGSLTLSDGAFLYLFGGWNGDDYLDTAYQYDPQADSWQEISAMKEARAFTTGQFISGRLYVLGGFDGETELASCAFYEVDEARWEDCEPMLSPRGGAGSAVAGNKLYVIGGGLNGRKPIASSESFNPNSETWQLIEMPMLTDEGHWYGLGVASVETQIFIQGGQLNEELVDKNYILNAVYQTFIPNIQTGGGE